MSTQPITPLTSPGRGSAGTYEINSWNLLNSLFNNTSNQASQFGTSGTSLLGKAADYWKSLLGSRTSATQAAGPGANAAVAANDARKKQEANMGTSRGGGTNAGNQKAQMATQAQIDAQIAAQRGQAAEQLGTLGESEINAMLSALGIGESAASAVGGQATGEATSSNANRTGILQSLIGIV